ncbi:NAD(+) diphosphatase [Clostridium massiliodielmoense]|uniref:NAD(+) diphosphatase n=1 Tax=Clostridium massiliodielmoense TaxID=1776385 RepID=UPI0001669FE7|nr:NUDIX domain-containing protein [Clostridium massiliodielmoense]EDS76364.1 hydrolase, nudix family [Clostridium botulinum C str. Eklund]KEH92630.1 DNA mismatch repair protein MutT [Clostridium botulinum C/D str. BKT12695]NEZ50433.1 NUDIX domain-containing protein [Clostridium botulinum]
MIYKFCPICGNKLELRDSWDEGYVPYCPIDDRMFFDLPKPCVVVAVLKEDKVLLMKQSYIYKDSKVLISGYVDIGEEAEDTVIREVKEETGITVSNVKYLGSDFVESTELLMLTFRADYLEGQISKSDEVEWVNWVNINDALPQMTEDKIGKRVIRKILEEDGYN